MKQKALALAVMSLVTFAAAAIVLFGRHSMSEQYIDNTARNNGGFETERNGMPANWLIYTAKTAGSGSFNISTDLATFHSGTRSLKFDVAECSATGGRLSPGIAQEYNVQPGKYTITCLVKNNGVKAVAKVNAVSAKNSVNNNTEQLVQAAADWEQHTLTCLVPGDKKQLRFEFNVLSAGTLWIDDIEVTRMP